MKRLSGLLKPKYSLLFIILFVVAVFAIEIITMRLYIAGYEWVTFQSPMPDIVIAKTTDKPDPKAYLKQYDFSADWFTRNLPVWEKCLNSSGVRPM